MGVSVTVVQHAEKERLPGDPGLTAGGRAEALATAQWLAATERARRIVASPMRRARETAEPIATLLGLDVEIDRRLRERMNWDGPQNQSFESFMADWVRATTERDFAPPSGDSSLRASARFQQFLADLARGHGDETVVVVTHGGITTDLLRDLLGDDELARVAPSVMDFGVPGCAVTRLEEADGLWHVVSTMSTEHLRPARAQGSRGTELIVRAVVHRDGHVLLARDRTQSWSSFPGGHVEAGEGMKAALVRELAEELGTKATIVAFLGAVEHRYRDGSGPRHELNVVFEVTLAAAEPRSREGHLEFHWLPFERLPGADIRPATLRDAVRTGSAGGRPFWCGWSDP